jgi:hypothetical protein
VKLFSRRGPSRVPICPIFLKPESQPLKNTVIQFLPSFHLDLCRFSFLSWKPPVLWGVFRTH